jgi:GntR family transcriptional regulator
MSNGVLDKNLAIPLYHQLQNILKAEIEAGRLSPDDRLPSEQEMAERFQVSKITVRQALTERRAARTDKLYRGDAPP